LQLDHRFACKLLIKNDFLPGTGPSMTAARKAPATEQFDIFLPYIADLPMRDQREMMERPFFSLAKSKRVKPIDYTSPDGKVRVHVSANPDYGMATIWDADILIYCISKIVAARDAGDNDFGPSIFVSPYELLKSIARETGGKNYQELMAAIKRLKTTTIETNIRGGKSRIAIFNWLAEVEGEGRESENPEQLKTLELRVSNWLFKGIMSGKGVLTLDREWFLLKGGLERVLYRIARKHAGDQAHGWTCRFDVLYQKTGSEEPQRNFAVRLRRLVKRDGLPRYTMRLAKTADGSEAVHFIARSHVKEEAAAPKSLGDQLASLRDDARTFWIDSGQIGRAHV
jgi:plasmid replication initiation protein